MTEIEQKALALLNEVRMEYGWDAHTIFSRHNYTTCEALCRAIEQHETFRQEVSDVVWDYYGGKHIPRTSMFAKFAIPKPDPLVAVVHKLGWDKDTAADLRAALEYSGYEIREKNDD